MLILIGDVRPDCLGRCLSDFLVFSGLKVPRLYRGDFAKVFFPH